MLLKDDTNELDFKIKMDSNQTVITIPEDSMGDVMKRRSSDCVKPCQSNGSTRWRSIIGNWQEKVIVTMS